MADIQFPTGVAITPVAADIMAIADNSDGNKFKDVTLAALKAFFDSGEVSSASNVGVGGIGLFKQKTGQDLEFRNINAGSAKITVVLDGANNEVDIDLGSVASSDLTDGASLMKNWIDDTTPQAGGDVDMNGFAIISVSNGDIPINPNGTGSVILDALKWPQSDGTPGQFLRTDGAGQLVFATPAKDFATIEVTGTSQAMVVDTIFIANNAGLITLTLPTTAAIGDTMKILGKGTGGWEIAQGAGQTIFFGDQTTTIGATGRLNSTLQRDSIELICVTADNDWQVASSIGNITVT